MHFRLSLLMFLGFAVLGAWSPMLAPCLSHLEFTPGQCAWVFASNALGAIFGPIVWGQIADRWLAAEKCVSCCCVVSGGCLWFVAGCARPGPVFWGCLVFWMFMIPALSVSAVVAFRHLPNPDRDYGRVRMWGTVGWIVSGWVLTAWFRLAYEPAAADANRGDALRLGAICAWVTAAYALSLPHSPPAPRVPAANGAARGGWLGALLEAPLHSLALFRNRSFAVLCGCLFAVYVTFTLSAQLTALVLLQLGVAPAWLPTVQTLAQSTEVIALGALPILVVRFGQKGIMLLGLVAWALALTVFSSGAPLAVVVASLGLHGVFITCFIVSAQLYINRLAHADAKASAQGLMQVMNGAGLFMGHLLVGALRGAVGERYALAFVPGAFIATAVVVLFTAGFSAERGRA